MFDDLLPKKPVLNEADFKRLICTECDDVEDCRTNGKYLQSCMSHWTPELWEEYFKI